MARKINGDAGAIKAAFNTMHTGCRLPFIPPSGDIEDYFDLDTGLGFDDFDGWCLLDGNNGTTDMSGRYPRAYGASGEDCGDLLGYQTALPNNDFTISTNDHSHGTVDQYCYKIYRISSDTNLDGGTFSRKNEGAGGSYGIENGYNDAYTFYWNDLDKTTTTDTHNHTISGGDDETRPWSVLVYFIARIDD